MREAALTKLTDSPDEIYLMELRFAKAYRFVADDGSDLGPAEAYTKVKAAGCTYATQAWVTNHWSMILWKLAGTIQAQYEFFERLWRWEEVINQLLYR
jgi:breast cancer 2 susceptibility protein